MALDPRCLPPRGMPPPTGTCLRPGPGAVCAVRRYPHLFPVLRGLMLYYQQRGACRRHPNSGSSSPPGPGPAPPGASPARPLSARDGLVLSGRAGRGADPRRRPWRSMTRRRTGPWRCATAWTSAWAWRQLARALWHLGFLRRPCSTARRHCTLAQELAHPFSLAHGAGLCSPVHQYRREVPAVTRGPRPP